MAGGSCVSAAPAARVIGTISFTDGAKNVTVLRMKKPYIRWIFLNLLCVAFGAALASVSAGSPFLPTALFVLVLVWLCNEVWNGAVFGAALLNAGWQWVKIRTVKKSLSPRVFTLTSLLLLLVPHVVFALLYAANALWDNQLAEAFGLAISHALFACAYAAVVLLWFLAFRGVVGPLSLEGLVITWMEPELDLRRSGDEIAAEMDCRRAEDSRPKPEPPAPLPPLAEGRLPADAAASTAGSSGSAATAGLPPKNPAGGLPAAGGAWPGQGWSPRHPRLRELLPELLYYGRPNLSVTNVYVRQNRNFGLVLALLVVPFLLVVCAALIPQYPLAAIVPGVLALAFGWSAWKLLAMPGRWREKLSRAEFAFTKTQVLIAEGQVLRSFALDSGLRMMYEEVDGDIATILFDHVDLHKNPVMKLLVKFGTVDDTNNALLEPGPLQGFQQIDDAPRVSLLLKQLGAKG